MIAWLPDTVLVVCDAAAWVELVETRGTGTTAAELEDVRYFTLETGPRLEEAPRAHDRDWFRRFERGRAKYSAKYSRDRSSIRAHLRR